MLYAPLGRSCSRNQIGRWVAESGAGSPSGRRRMAALSVAGRPPVHLASTACLAAERLDRRWRICSGLAMERSSKGSEKSLDVVVGEPLELRDEPLLDELPKGRDGRGLEQAAQGDVDREALAQPGEDLRREQGVAAELEKVVVPADSLDSQELPPEGRDRL